MKRLIAIVSTGMAIGFAIALANAQDSSMSGSDTMSSPGVSQQQPGTAGNMDTGSADTSKDMSTATETMTKETKTKKSEKTAKTDYWKSAKSCTDDQGVSHRRGTKAFKSCVEKKRQQEQMGGTMGSDTSMDQSNVDQSGSMPGTAGTDSMGNTGMATPGPISTGSSGY